MKFELEKYNVQDDYFNIGTLDNLIMSSSAYAALDFETGGGLKKFLQFYTDSKQTFSKALEDGTVIHEYVEKESNFKIADFDLPGEKVIEWVVFIIENQLPLTNENVLLAKNELGIYNNYKKEEAIISAFQRERGEHLYNFITESKDYHVISASSRDILLACKESIENNKLAWNLLFSESFDKSIERIKERVIIFELFGLPHKSKIDTANIDHTNKKIKLVDLKTISANVYSYAPLVSLPVSSDSINYLHYNKFPFFSRKVYRQMYIYNEALKSLYPDYDIETYIVVVRRNATFDTAVYKVPMSVINLGYEDVSLHSEIVKDLLGQGVQEEPNNVVHPYEKNKGYLEIIKV